MKKVSSDQKRLDQSSASSPNDLDDKNAEDPRTLRNSGFENVEDREPSMTAKNEMAMGSETQGADEKPELPAGLATRDGADEASPLQKFGIHRIENLFKSADENLKRSEKSLARLRDDDLASSNQRWRVGESTRQCHRCQQDLTSSFHTALIAEESIEAAEGERTFRRVDICEACFDLEDQPETFAHWTTHRPEGEEEPRVIVNLASLREYFDNIDAKLRELDEDSDQVNHGEELASLRRSLEELHYLLGLFLVRKRVFTWVAHEGHQIQIEGRQCGTTYRLTAHQDLASGPGSAAEFFSELFDQ